MGRKVSVKDLGNSYLDDRQPVWINIGDKAEQDEYHAVYTQPFTRVGIVKNISEKTNPYNPKDIRYCIVMEPTDGGKEELLGFNWSYAIFKNQVDWIKPQVGEKLSISYLGTLEENPDVQHKFNTPNMEMKLFELEVLDIEDQVTIDKNTKLEVEN